MTAPRSWLTGDDLIALSARIAAELDQITGRVPSIAEDFNRCLSTAGEAIGRRPWDFNASELDELADMVCDAIAGRDPAQHCFREDGCGTHIGHDGPGCCCCGQPADVHEGCDCDPDPVER